MEDSGPEGSVIVIVGGMAGRSSASEEVESHTTGDEVTTVGRAGVIGLIRIGAGTEVVVSSSVGIGWQVVPRTALRIVPSHDSGTGDLVNAGVDLAILRFLARSPYLRAGFGSSVSSCTGSGVIDALRG